MFGKNIYEKDHKSPFWEIKHGYLTFFFILDRFEPEKALTKDDIFFHRALENAQFCFGSTHPNPAVGAVLVRHEKIIAEGYTQPVGGIHAEVDALNKADESLIKNSTLFVTLEPCSHYGRTPPCTQSIITAGIKRVVIGCQDPNPLVAGRGIKALKKAGIAVEKINNPALKKMAEALALPFRTWIKKKRPYIIVKIAISNDYKITGPNFAPIKITNTKSDIVSHKLRRAVDAVAISAATARNDNPILTSRSIDPSHNHQPDRVIFSTDLNLDEKLKIFECSKANTILVTKKNFDQKIAQIFLARGVNVIGCQLKGQQLDLQHAFSNIAELGITSTLVEPGASLLKSLLKTNVVDEIWLYKSLSDIGHGGLDVKDTIESLPHLGWKSTKKVSLGSDVLTIFSRQ